MTPRPGSAEFLRTLLIASGGICPHQPKLIPGRESGIPYRLGLFFDEAQRAGTGKWHEAWMRPTHGSIFDNVLNLDTTKLCSACYSLAAPHGFITCSMPYNLEELRDNPRPRKNGLAASETRQYGSLPQQVIPSSSADGEDWLALYQTRADGTLKPFLNQVAMPEVLAFFQHLGQPFCMDALHSRKDWNFEATEEEQVEQLKRVYEDNVIVYENATTIWLPAGATGLGKSSMAEQRIGRNRLRIIPERWNEADPGEVLDDVDRFSIVPTIPRGNYLYPWPQETYPSEEQRGNSDLTRPSSGALWNIDAVPLRDKIQNQIQKAPNMPQSYLTEAQRVIEGYYRGGSVDGIPVHWPDPVADGLDKSKVDDAESRMTGTITEPADVERMRYEEEGQRQKMYENRTRLIDEHERARRIRKLYRVNGVPENLLLKDGELPAKEWEPDSDWSHLREDSNSGHW